MSDADTITFFEAHKLINRQVTIFASDRPRYLGMTGEDRLAYLGEPRLQRLTAASAPSPKETTPTASAVIPTEAPPITVEEALANTKRLTFQACKFLHTWPTDPTLTAIHIDPVTGEKGLIETKSFQPDANGRVDWQAVHAWIDARQGKANIYFLVNRLRAPKNSKAAKSDIAEVVALHVDVDVRVGEDQDEGVARVVKQLQEYDPPPEIIIASGGGAQGFWLLEEPIKLDGTKEAIDAAEELNKQLAAALDGDHCQNIDRIMRVPFTVNLPDKTKLAKGRTPRVARLVRWRPNK